MKSYQKILLCVVVSSISFPANAKTWTTDYGKSSLGFVASQSGQAIKGQFKKFDATIDFDPAKPETGKITATIDIASAVTGREDADGMLPQSDWFDSKKFPQAVFTTTTIKADSKPSCYIADATLAIKGVSKNVTLPFCLTPEGDAMRAKGEVLLTRTDFSIGTGQWASDATVGHAVTVTVDLLAR